MPIASETLCVSSQKGSEFCGENTKHKKIDDFECQSSFSCSYVDAEKSCRQEINGNFCYSKSCIREDLFKTNNGALCNSENPCSDVDHETFDAVQQDLRQQMGSSLRDLYMQDHYDDEDVDEDSDWEPVNHFIIKKWFCPNCTMPNFDDVCHCDVCGEHMDSGISGYDSFLTHIGQVAWISTDSDVVHNGQDSPSEMCTAIGFDERMLLHSEVEVKPHPHPERPDRLRAIAASLASAGIFPGKCYLIATREITCEELQLVHSVEHIEAVQGTSQLLSSYFTSDTYANEHSACAARIAAGLCADLARSIISGCTKNGFALSGKASWASCRYKTSNGFLSPQQCCSCCIGSQECRMYTMAMALEIFDGNKSVKDVQERVLYVSLHRHEGGGFYPGTGAVAGILDAKAYLVNIPWSCGGVGDNDYIFAFQNIVLPIASEFAPDITIVSAGFDAARGDPLGCCDVTPAGYAQMTYMLTSLSKGKLLVTLEGGYNLRSISSSATAVVKVLLGENPGHEISDILPSKEGLQTVLQVLKIQLKFWPVLRVKLLNPAVTVGIGFFKHEK